MKDPQAQDSGWPQARWSRILDRIEFRQAGLGLKYWGPPLWLEVTMSGPDSDRWPAAGGGNESWNWQSTATCVEAERLLDHGASDEQLLVTAGRYTVENLVLNAVHEIGEWLRFDGRRVFSAHPSAQASLASGEGQGNGSVELTVSFSPPAPSTTASPVARPEDQLSAQRRLRRLTELAGPSRFTYLPGTTVDYLVRGPLIRLHRGLRPRTGWQSVWSSATADAVRSGADVATLIGCVQRDVHRALVAWEADRVCRALFIDRRQRWQLSAPGVSVGTGPAADHTDVDEILTFTIAYLPTMQC